MAAVLPLLLVAACRKPATLNGQLVEPATKAELAGTNWDGKLFRLSDHSGKVAVVFFGYTFCPNVCPLTLAKMKQLYGRLGERAANLEVVFVSVDPKRDTVEKLAQYIPSFDRRFYGLHIAEEKVEETLKPFGATVAYGAPRDGQEAGSFYFVDHTANYFVIDRQGMLRLKFPPNATVDQMLPDIERLLAT